MADSKYESKIGQIACNEDVVFAVLSNLENLNRFSEMIPKDKVKELEITSDYIRMKVEGLAQKFTIRIVEKEEFTVETLAGIMIPKMILADGKVTGVRVDMGIPSFAAADVPMNAENTLQQKITAAV